MNFKLLRSEVLKLRTVRTVTWLALASVALTALSTTAIGLGTVSTELQTEGGVRSTLAQGGFAAGLLALILGVVVSAGEYRHGTIAPTLLITPSRGRVVGTQVLAHGLAGLLLGVAATGTCLILGLPILAARRVDLPLSGSDLAAIVVGGVLFAGLSAALGSALGSLLGNQVVAVGLALMVMFVVEPVLTMMIDGYQNHSLVAVRTAIIGGSAQMSGDPAGQLMPVGQALTFWISLTLLITAGGLAATRHREIR